MASSVGAGANDSLRHEREETLGWALLSAIRYPSPYRKPSWWVGQLRMSKSPERARTMGSESRELTLHRCLPSQGETRMSGFPLRSATWGSVCKAGLA